MTTFIALRVDDDDEADDLLSDLRGWPEHDLLTPCLENKVHAQLVVAVRDARPYVPPRSELDTFDSQDLMALQDDLDELERTDPKVRAAAQSLDAAIDRIGRRSTA